MAKSLKIPEQQEAAPKESTPAPVRNPYPPGFNPVVQARKLYEAMDGMGTDERAIFDVLRSGRSDLNRAIETAFNRMYSGNLRSWLQGDLGGSDYTKAIQLLGRGDFTLTQKLNQAADGWGTDEEKIFHALEVAPKADLAEVRSNAYLMNRLRSELNTDDYKLALAYLDGRGALASKLRRAVNGWGTDEAAIWRAIDKAPENDRLFVLGQPALMSSLRSDFSSDDYLRAKRMLRGTWDNVDKIEVAMKGVGTDEAMLLGAIAGLSQAEYSKIGKGTTELPNGISSLKFRLEGELSGADEFEALESLHQKQLAFDATYAIKYREAQAKKLGEAALADAGSAALMAGDGQSMSAVAQLRKACVGLGTDEESIWDVCARIPSEQGRWILKYNPENIVGILRSDLDISQYFRVRTALGGGAWGKILVLRNAVEGAGTNEAQIYDAIDSIITEGVAGEVLNDGHILRQLQGDLDSQMYDIFVEAMRTSTFTPMNRLGWATVRYGTDEDLVWEVCAQYGSEWFSGGEIRADVNEILRSELATRDYWKAKDIIRGEPTTEQEKLERSKEMLERERSGDTSVWLVDQVSDSGQNADEAWREYQVTYNQAYEDGKVSEEEQSRLKEAEDYSKYTTDQYREAKASFAQWASQIAITIVGIVATVLTAGAAAGPFIAGLAANAGTIATTMVAAAALKVGIHKAIEGEGYDLSSMDTLVDGVGAAIEGGLFVVGNLGAASLMRGLSKSKYAASMGPTVEKAFGGAGKRILSGGLEGSIDGTLGGMGEGLFRGLANDKTWSGSMGDAFSNIGATTLLHSTLGGTMGFGGGSLFRSIGETFGPSVRKLLAKGTTEGMAPGSGSVDDVMAKMPDDLENSLVDRKRLTAAAFETNQRMQEVADSVTDEFGLPSTKVGLKGNKFGTDDISKVDEDAFIGKVLEKQRRWGEPESIGGMTDMSRGRFDVDSFDEATAIAESLESRFTKAFGSDNVTVKPPRDVYKRYHILVRDPHTGVFHEWQIGTNALTKFIEDVPVKLPKGVELHGDDFHVVMYDVLAKLDEPDIRAKHGLPDGIVDDIGLGALQKKYDALMLEAGTATKGAPEPINFDERLAGLADELGAALENLERKHPGLATKLDTKLAADKAAAARAAAQPEADGPAHQPDMPAADTGVKTTAGQDTPQPKVRPEHEGSVEYREYKNAVAFAGEGGVNPHSAKQGALGDCYLLAGAAAEARANPAGVRRLIKDNGDGTFDVTLHFREDWWSDPVAKTVTVDGKFPTKGGAPVYAKIGQGEGGDDEIWMALFEKALAKETGSYDLISGGNITKHTNFGGVHELLTGNKVKMVNTDSMGEEALLRRMSDALENKEPIAVGTYNFNDDATARVAAEKLNIYANHAYSVESVDLDAGTVNLQNPWGSRHPTNVLIEDFRKYYKRLDIGTSAKSKGPGVGGDQFEGGAAGKSMLRGLSQVGDNVGMTVARSTNAATALASSRGRFEVSEELKETKLGPGDIVFPGEAIRAEFWHHLNAPGVIKFEGKLEGKHVVFFVEPGVQVVIISSLEGQYLTAFTAPSSLISHLLTNGEM